MTEHPADEPDERPDPATPGRDDVSDASTVTSPEDASLNDDD